MEQLHASSPMWARASVGKVFMTLNFTGTYSKVNRSPRFENLALMSQIWRADLQCRGLETLLLAPKAARYGKAKDINDVGL